METVTEIEQTRITWDAKSDSIPKMVDIEVDADSVPQKIDITVDAYKIAYNIDGEESDGIALASSSETESDNTQQLDGAAETNNTQQLDDAAETNNTQQLDGAAETNNTQQLDGAAETNNTQQLDGAAETNNTQQLYGAAETNNTQQLDGAAETNKTVKMAGVHGTGRQSPIGSEKETEGDSQHFIRHTFHQGQLSLLGGQEAALPPKIVEDYCKVTLQLDLSFNRFRSLDGLEHFQNLQELVLDNNELPDQVVFPRLPHLHTLTLNKNRISDLQGLLEQLQEKCPKLTYLSLLGNEACPNELSSRDKDDEDYQRYRYYVLYKLPLLKFLDSSPVNSAELIEAKRVGPYTLIVRPKEEEEVEEGEDAISVDIATQDLYTPLPAGGTRDHSKHQAYWSKNKSKYVGRNSEGNRFITDGAL